MSMMSLSVAISNSNVVMISLSSNDQPTMDYSHGVLSSMCAPSFPMLHKQLGPFLVDKTKLIKNIVKHGLNGNVDLVLRPRRCSKTTMLHMLK